MTSTGKPDLSAFANLGAAGSSLGSHEVIKRMQADVERSNAIRARVRDFVGRASSSDGQLSATCTSDTTLAELSIDPRALRLPSKELAARIVRVTAQARADLERQRADVLTETETDLDSESSRAMLGELSSAYTRSMSEIETVFERFRDGLKR